MSRVSVRLDIWKFISDLLVETTFGTVGLDPVFLSGDDEMIIIDSMNEYFDIAETDGGSVVYLSTYTDNYVNPLAMMYGTWIRTTQRAG